MKFKLLFCLYAALVFVAYFHPLDLSVFSTRNGKTYPHLIVVMYLSGWAAPMLPAFIACCSLLGLNRFSPFQAKLLATLSVVAGLFLTLASGVLTLFSVTQALRGLTLTIAVASSFLIWSGKDDRAQPSLWAKACLSVATLAALWSVLTVPNILLQARWIADGSPYCIAHHRRDTEVRSLPEMRGFSFFTTNTGYKSTSKWYFHGLLIVDRQGEQMIYNWSPRRWRFDLVTKPDVFVIPVRDVCVPH